MKVKSSVRKTQTEYRILDRTFNKIKKGAGINSTSSKTKQDLQEDTTQFLSIKQKSMLNTYGDLFDYLNKNDQNLKSDNFTWDSVQKAYYVRNKDFKSIKKENEVFGWHPYWMGSKWKSYPFELLSTLAYFSYKVDPYSGGYKNPAQIEEWKTTAMIDSAKVKNTRVLLTVSCHGYSNNREFLQNPDRWDYLVETLEPLLNMRQADGIDLNFEMVPYSEKNNLNRFIEYFRNQFDTKFQNQNKNFYLSLTLPANDSREIFNVKNLNDYVDLFVIMGYDYHIGEKLQGAVSPLRSSEGSDLSLNKTVNYYLEYGINPQKTILALPYYGSLWTGKLSKDNSKVYNETSYKKPLTYSEIRQKYVNNENVDITSNRDERSMTNYYNIAFKDYTTQEVWFDDDYTLGKKYDFALSKKLKGVGIWALGYDNGYNDLWNVIENKFSTDQKIIVNPINEADGYPIKLSKFLIEYKLIFITTSIFFLITVILAFLVLLFDYNIRNSIVKSQLNVAMFIGIVFILLIPITIVIFERIEYLLGGFNLVVKPYWSYYLSFFIGVLTMYLAYRIKIKSIERP
ncbi:glycoside hydrolase family 18 protein [Psychroflexus planctonicus]|uniref:chitinase n=1 Tax=Psychroflexus planctonicus TaxID=1526575 RepID=A0ABQ1SK71_9FLAO|nr:glycosyl hydrolase family 18 protein [Psychroflexus planctonicus]GGE40947.1 hypothetical protein GCM10010832_21280 [Psychroflexus planctonicus]